MTKADIVSKRTSIRIPDDLYTRLAKRASSERRSVSNLIVTLLELALLPTKLPTTDSDRKVSDEDIPQ